MSLINQVLKDLEKRHAPVDAGALTRAVRPLPEEPSRRRVWIALGATLVVLAAVGAGWWTMQGAKVFLPEALPPAAANNVSPAAHSSTVAAANTKLAPSAPSKPDLAPGTSAPAPVPPASIPSMPVAPPAANTTSSQVAPPAASSPGVSVAVKTAASAPAPAAARVNPANALKRPAPTLLASPAALPASSQAPMANADTEVNKSPEAVSATSTLPVTDSEAAPAAKPGATAARTKQRGVAEGAPKISAAAQSVEYPADKAGPSDANIAKQVRPLSNRERAEVSFRQGMTTLQNGNVPEAEVALHEALRLDPLLDKARQALLGLYIEAGRRDEAEQLLDERLKLDGKHFGFALALARLQLEHASNGDALATLQRSLPYGENSPDYQAMLANALSRVARHKEAAERYDIASRIAPRNPLWQMGLGVELRADNRNAEARAAFQRARELGGLNAQLTSYLDQQLHELQ